MGRPRTALPKKRYLLSAPTYHQLKRIMSEFSSLGIDLNDEEAAKVLIDRYRVRKL